MHRYRSLLLAALLVGGIGFTSRVTDDASQHDLPVADSMQPEFYVARFRNTVYLRGHMSSVVQEQALLDLAKSLYPDFVVQSEFVPNGLVPAHWEDTIGEALRALAAARSGSVELVGNQVRVQVVATDDDAWRSHLAALETSLPVDVAVTSQTIHVAPADVNGLCGAAFADFNAGAINFEESTAEFRAAAYPALERLAALANACRDAKLRITGHTDSSGSAAWNQVLSLRRAEAVAAFLVSKGIAADRLEPIGAGSGKPLAGNETRYGRGLNRRIEVEFLPQ